MSEATQSQLLELKNTGWFSDEDNELPAHELATRITLGSISVEPDGKCDFWFDDNDLLGGHAIHVSANIQEGVVDACLEG